MNQLRPAIAMLIVAACASFSTVRETWAQGSVTIIEEPGAAAADPTGCGCRSGQVPPWHGNVRGTACPPRHHHHGVFHADPCGQLGMLCHRNRCGASLPPCFPRLHSWCAEGQMPTPRPLALPRCHQCGAMIEGGF